MARRNELKHGMDSALLRYFKNLSEQERCFEFPHTQIILCSLLLIIFLFFASVFIFHSSQLSLLIFESLLCHSLHTVDHLFPCCSLSVSLKLDSLQPCAKAEAAIKKIYAYGFSSHFDLTVQC